MAVLAIPGLRFVPDGFRLSIFRFPVRRSLFPVPRSRISDSRIPIPELRVSIDAPRELGVVELVGRDREVHVRPVRRVRLEERALREDLLLRTPILTNHAAHVGETLAPRKRPERLL